MRKVTLKSLTLVNFRGEKERTTRFNADVTTISGANGLGKSRHFDAFIWLLFGKDVADRKDYEIRSIVDGEPLHKAECSVTGVLDVDGEEITLKRSYCEDWVKPRKQVEAVFTGNHTECLWNETPVTVGEYSNRVHAIIDSVVFKMITNPAYFANMPWKAQREQLFMLGGQPTDMEIAANNPEVAKLLDAIKGKSLEDFRKEISFKKKNLKAALDKIAPKIEQTYKLMPEAEDWAKIEADLQATNGQIKDLEQRITDCTAQIRAQYEGEQEKQKQVNELKRQRQQALFDAQAKARQAAFEANAARREAQMGVDAMQRESDSLQRELKMAQTELDNLMAKAEQLTKEREQLLKDWYAENGYSFNDTPQAKAINASIALETSKEYQGETVCPHCGQPIPQADQERAREIFESAKDAAIKELEGKLQEAAQAFKQRKGENLNKITAQGKRANEQIKEIEESIAQAKEALEKAKNRVAGAQAKMEDAKSKLASMPETAPGEVNPAMVPEIAALDKQIVESEALIATKVESSDADEVAKCKDAIEVLRKAGEAMALALSKRDTISKLQSEIASLEDEGKKLSQQIAEIEAQEYAIVQFNRIKVEECEKRINSMFHHVTFRLFDYTIEGKKMNEPNETCIPLIDGVPYGSANTAGKINAGLDIINALCRFYGICAPIFIDNRESVNDIIPMQSQIINLVVTTDSELTIK